MFDIVTLSFYGWFLLGLIVFVLGSVLISRRVQNWNDKNSETTACDNEKDLFKHERLTGTICVEANGPSLDKHDEETKEASAKFDNSGARCYGIDDLVSSRPISNSQAPLTQGTDANSVDWINSCIKWLYSNHNADLFVAEWLCSLNDQIRRASSETENDVRVELLQIQPESLPPHLSDFCTTPESNDNITTTCKVKNENLGFKILIICKVGENTSAIHYDLTIDKLEGKLKVFSNVKELLFIFCFVERPDVKLTLKPFHGPPKILATDQNSMEAVAMDILINTIATTAVSLHFAKQTDFPKFQSKGRNSLILEDLSTSPSRHPSTRHEQRLLLKIIKATGLGGKKGCQEPYCVVKLDEPFQRFQTSPAKNASNPFWDEPFLFNLNETSAEIVFEIYEFGNDGEEQLLSLGMIGVKEIINSPSQRLVIPLQSQPTRSDFVTGSITVEFLIMEGAEVPVVADIYETQPGLLKKTDNQLIQEGIEVTTSTLDKVESMEGSDETLTDTAAQEMDKIGNFSTYENGTLVIHSAHKEVIRPVLKSEVTADSNNASSSPISKSKQTLSRQSMSSSASEKDEVFISSAEKGGTKDKRSFMGTLRKRLSFRKNRSKSVEQKGKPEESIGQENTKSVSTDHSKSVPSSQEVSSARSSDGNAFLDVPGVAYDRNSTISEGSGISISSQRTYVHEQSTLVVETNENGVIRHYLVPGSLANQSKWGKRGAKLHIYNDHIFVAKHLPGSTICQVCKKKLSRRPGKQGYECRDCSLLCHKSCHVRVEMYCPNTTINTMDISYDEPPEPIVITFLDRM
ncbi:uncharacterized protein LOC143236001 isoform X5 [Tachypleus tridentatus]|uniref:uncharacterized protein LOC143236001 isoform X5 n=1 Tax=Tachypleus tridentatus TaxID=6853 RepID=UPI003FD59598